MQGTERAGRGKDGGLRNTLSCIVPEEQLPKFSGQYLVPEKENKINIVFFPSICSQRSYTVMSGVWECFLVYNKKPPCPSNLLSSNCAAFERTKPTGGRRAM